MTDDLTAQLRALQVKVGVHAAILTAALRGRSAQAVVHQVRLCYNHTFNYISDIGYMHIHTAAAVPRVSIIIIIIIIIVIIIIVIIIIIIVIIILIITIK